MSFVWLVQWMSHGRRGFFSSRGGIFQHNHIPLYPHIFDLIFFGHSYFIFFIPIYLTHCADISPHCHIKFHFKIDVAICQSWTCIFTQFRFAKCNHVSINKKGYLGMLHAGTLHHMINDNYWILFVWSVLIVVFVGPSVSAGWVKIEKWLQICAAACWWNSHDVVLWISPGQVPGLISKSPMSGSGNLTRIARCCKI